VSLTGQASNKDFHNLDIATAAEVVNITNKRIAEKIGVKASERSTVTKPSGSASLILGTSSGIHAWHSKYYIRRVRVGKHETIYNYILKHQPSLLEDDKFEDKTAIISIPIKAPENAIIRSDETSIDLLNRVKYISNEWIKNGHIIGDNTHNVSVTVSVKDNDWKPVGDWMWENRNDYNGIAVLPYDGGSYEQAPFEEISEDRYNELYNKLIDIDFSQIVENEDNTEQAQEVACAGGKCEL